jgi:hypothetical protein
LRVYLIVDRITRGVRDAEDINRPIFKTAMRSLVEMLEVNQSLEYLDVVIPFGHVIYLDDSDSII